MVRRPPRSTLDRSSAASDVYKRQGVLETYHLPLNAAEGVALNRSAALIRGLIDQLDHD